MKRKTRKPPPSLRPEDRQRANVREELHAYVDRAVDDWPLIEEFASDLGWSRGSSETRGSGVSDPTLAAVLAMSDDPHHSWLRSFKDLHNRLRLLDADRERLQPKKPKQERENAVEICALCSMPAPQVRRIDGQPYCHSRCYWSETRRRRGATG